MFLLPTNQNVKLLRRFYVDHLRCYVVARSALHWKSALCRKGVHTVEVRERPFAACDIAERAVGLGNLIEGDFAFRVQLRGRLQWSKCFTGSTKRDERSSQAHERVFEVWVVRDGLLEALPSGLIFSG
jgi:hypothetical protein